MSHVCDIYDVLVVAEDVNEGHDGPVKPAVGPLAEVRALIIMKIAQSENMEIRSGRKERRKRRAAHIRRPPRTLCLSVSPDHGSSRRRRRSGEKRRKNSRNFCK